MLSDASVCMMMAGQPDQHAQAHHGARQAGLRSGHIRLHVSAFRTACDLLMVCEKLHTGHVGHFIAGPMKTAVTKA